MAEPEPEGFQELYHKEVTRASFEELKALVEWCNRVLGYHPTIIGGWAVWAYVEGLGSRDIDIVLPTRKSVHATLRPFYRARGYQERGLLVKRFVRVLDLGDREEEIQIDGCSYQDRNVLHEDGSVTVPWTLLTNYQRPWALEGLEAYIPTKELLLIYKVKAYRDRKYDLEHRLPNPPQRLYLQSKIWKDSQDLLGLRKTGFDEVKLQNLLSNPELEGLRTYLDRTLAELT